MKKQPTPAIAPADLAPTWRALTSEDRAVCSAWDCDRPAAWCETRRFVPNGATKPSLGFYYFCAAHADAPILPADLLSFAADDAPSACDPDDAPDALDALYAESGVA